MTSPGRVSFVRAAGAVALALVLAWFLGGQMALRRIDPALALPLLPIPALLLAWAQRGDAARDRWRTIGVALILLAATQAALTLALADRPPWHQLALVASGWVGIAWIVDRVLQWRRGRGVTSIAALLLVVAGFAAGHAALGLLYRTAAAAGPAATMLTGLPLRWSGGTDLGAMLDRGTNEDPALVRLEAAGPVRLVDSFVDSPPPPGGALLLAHPRALAPQELVAIDAFVRGGGRAVILADALTGWPMRHPVGDSRNPPVTSLLTPMLDHWGVTLEGAAAGEDRPVAADVDGARLQLFSAGRFDRLPDGCKAYEGKRVAHCRIGRGDVWLVGDADLLFAPLWQPPRPWASHLRQSDAMEWLASRLWPDAPHALLQPLWIRAAAQ